MTEDIIEIEITITPSDVALARLLVYFRSGLGIAIAAFGVLLLVLDGFRPRVVPSIPFMMPLLCLLILPLAVAYAGLFGRAIGLWLTTLRYTFTEEGFHVVAPHLQAHLGWSDVAAAYQSRKRFVLSTPGALQVIPTRNLQNEEILALRSLLASALGSRAKFRP